MRGSFTKVKKGDYKGGETKGRDIVAVDPGAKKMIQVKGPRI